MSIRSIHEWWCGVVVNLGVFPGKRLEREIFCGYQETLDKL